VTIIVARTMPPCVMAGLGPMGIRIRPGQRRSIPPSSCPDLHAPAKAGDPGTPTTAGIRGDRRVKPGDDDGEVWRPDKTILRRILILMPIGHVPATHDLRGGSAGKSWVTGPRPVMTKGKSGRRVR
jgi:hypothetical protein